MQSYMLNQIWYTFTMLSIISFLYSITENQVEPLRAQLLELDQMIGDKHDQIGAIKSNLLKNDEKISKMLGSVANTT